MTAVGVERRVWSATLILDAEDAYARGRGFSGQHPRPVGRVWFSAVAELLPAGRRALAEPLRLVVTANNAGYQVFRGDVVLPDGSLRRGLLAPGSYWIRAESDYYQPLEVPVDLPRPDGPLFFDLEPDHRYPFPDVEPLRVPADPTGFPCAGATIRQAHGPTLLRGSLHAPDATPIRGATVTVPNQSNTFQTDASGQWVLWFPDTQPTGRQTVRFRLLPGAAPVDVQSVCIARGFETSLGETTIRGQVRRGNGAPISGARIRVSGHLPEVRSRGDGSWSYYFALDQGAETVTVTADVAGGATVALPNVAVVPRATTVVPTFQFT